MESADRRRTGSALIYILQYIVQVGGFLSFFYERSGSSAFLALGKFSSTVRNVSTRGCRCNGTKRTIVLFMTVDR